MHRLFHPKEGKLTNQPQAIKPIIEIDDLSSKRRLRDLPYWFFALILIAIFVFYVISSNENYNNAFVFIKAGLIITIKTTLIAFSIAILFGLLAGLGRISKSVVINNLARLYVELIRGIPILVLIFFIALVGVPVLVDSVNGFGLWLDSKGVGFLGSIFTALNNQNISMKKNIIF